MNTRPWPSPLREKAFRPTFTGRDMPRNLLDLVWRTSAWDQMWLSLLSLSAALLDTAPIEVQRRLVNAAVPGGDYRAILALALTYAGLVLVEGLIKLAMRIYSGWVSENAVRGLRTAISTLLSENNGSTAGADIKGVQVSMILSESEPVGGFVGDSVSEPLLQGGILVSVFGYMAYVQPTMALVSFVVFSPQFVFVPLIQRAINRRVMSRVHTLRQASASVIGDQSEVIAAHVMQETRFGEIFRLNMGIFELKFTMNFLMNLTHHFGIVIILALGAWYVVIGRIEIGTVVAFVSGMRNINDPWGDLVNWFQNAMVTSTKYDLVLAGVETISKAAPEPHNNRQTGGDSHSPGGA